jgi:eukaryotic-like serine/threonine-protein kinase
MEVMVVMVSIAATLYLGLVTAVACGVPVLGVVALLLLRSVGRPPAPRSMADGRYELVAKLAEGGMGQVWQARDQVLARPVVVKLIRRELLSCDAVLNVRALARFELEAQCIASLRSPHTVALHDYGTTRDGIAYYVMELLRGIDLDELVERFGPQPPARVVHILRQICHSLAEAHGLGMIHRDIKPGNVRVTVQAGDHDVVKVMDFGLARTGGEPATGRLTEQHVVLGTPAFFAPEQALGDERGDHRIDLYALGCVAYFLLTGRGVFPAQSFEEVVLCHLHQTPDPPSTHVSAAIPPELERLVLDLLAKDPGQRPSSAAEVARRLADVPLDFSWTASLAQRWWQTQLPDVIGTCEDVALPRREPAPSPRQAPTTRARRRRRCSMALMPTAVRVRRAQGAARP